MARIFTIHSITRASACALLSLAAPLAAQRTWIVDQNNGPGTHFTGLQPCVDQAADGDTILVRMGDYSASVSKGVTILGITGAGVFPGADLKVENLPAGKTCVLKHLGDPSGHGTLVVNNCLGRVLIEDFNHQRLGGPLAVINCAHVTLAGLYTPNATATITNSNVVLTAPRVFTYPGSFDASGGLHLQNSTMWITGGSVQGGKADCQSFQFPTCAISMDQGSTLNLSRTSIAAGADSCMTARYVPAIKATAGCTVRMDPSALVSGTNGPGVSGATVLVEEVPGMTAAFAVVPGPAGSLNTDLYANAGNPFATFASLPGNAVDLPPLIWLDPNSTFSIDAGVMASGWRPRSYTLALGIPRGLALVTQSVVFSQAQSRWLSSTPATVVLAP